MANQDKIYRSPMESIEPFEFNENVAQVFDDMAKRSIPQYEQLQHLISLIIKKIYKYKGYIYDLGCSTGTTIFNISQNLSSPELKIKGIDNSKAMIDKAKEKLSQFKLAGDISLESNNVTQIELPNAEIIVMNFLLQFIPKEEKVNLLSKVYEALPTGGYFILSEKLKYEQTDIQKVFTDIYYDFKLSHGYSDLEISQKREALDNQLTPLSHSDLTHQLQQIGFTSIFPFFHWTYFASFLVIK